MNGRLNPRSWLSIWKPYQRAYIIEKLMHLDGFAHVECLRRRAICIGIHSSKHYDILSPPVKEESDPGRRDYWVRTAQGSKML
jgi:hypothetical protein